MRHFRAGPVAALGFVLFVLGIAIAPSSDGAVATNDVFTVPAGGAFPIQGLGNGHGHGMSQYGALGAANRGLSSAQILAFYYPGTQLANAGGAQIAVAISVGANDLEVAPASGLAVRDLANGSTPTLPDGPSRWQLAPVPGSAQTVLNYLDGAGWHQIQTFSGDAEFVNTGGAPIALINNGRSYRGTLRSVSQSASNRIVVNVVSVEDYVRGVVPSEMPSSWTPAAVQAQAVAARTYGLFERNNSSGRAYDICDSTYCQVYGGVSAERSGSDAAVAATAGQFLAYGGAPAFTQFSSSDGGWTSAGSQPYLPHQIDPYDPATGWTVQGSAAPLEAKYPQIGQLTTITVVSREGGGNWDGRVLSMVLGGTAGQVQITGYTFQAIFGLSSNWFTLTGKEPLSTGAATYIHAPIVTSGSSVGMPAPGAHASVEPATSGPTSAELEGVAPTSAASTRGGSSSAGSKSAGSTSAAAPTAAAPVVSRSCRTVTMTSLGHPVTRTACTVKVVKQGKAKKPGATAPHNATAPARRP